MKCNYIFLSLIGFFFYQFLYGFVIDEPGKYVFGDNLNEFGADVLVIAADDVIIDLNQHFIADGTNGIVISSGHHNIQILNGFVDNLSLSGLSIQDTCSAILIQNVSFSSCEHRAIELLGTDTGGISDVFLSDVTIDNCAVGASADSVIQLEGSYNISINSGKIMNSGTDMNDIAVLRVLNSSGCTISDVNMINNQGSSFIGIDVINTSNCQFAGCSILDSYADNVLGNFTGVRITGTQQAANFFSKCLIVSNTGNNEFVGFDMQNNSAGNSISKSKVHDNIGNSLAVAFRISGTGSPTSTINALFNEVSAIRNSAIGVSAIAAGFQIDGSDNGVIQNSIIGYQDAEQGEAYGVLVLDGNGWFFINNEIIGNEGSSDANSFGINVVLGDNILANNIVCENGSLASNQIAGISQQIKGLDINGIFSTLNTINVDVNGTLTSLENLIGTVNVDFEGTFTTLTNICEKIVAGFEDTFTVLNTINLNILLDITPLSVEGTINLPGNYRLLNDLDVNLDSAFEIAANGVCLDLNGHTITNVGGVGIQINGQNDIRIKNGFINTVTGIVFLNTCTNISMENISFINNDLGLIIEEGIGFGLKDCAFRASQQCIDIMHSRNGTIEHCSVAENIVPSHLAILVGLFDCNNVVFADLNIGNNIFLDSGAALALDNCSDMNLQGLQVNANFALDTLVSVSVTSALGITFNNCEVKNNNIEGSVSGSLLAGFGVFGSENVVFRNCQASEQVANNANSNRAVGFFLNATTRSAIIDSLAFRNRGATNSIGMLLENSSTNNIVKLNNIIDNGSVGIQELTSSSDNGILTNYAEGNSTNFDLIDDVPITVLNFLSGIVFPLLGAVTAFDNISA